MRSFATFLTVSLHLLSACHAQPLQLVEPLGGAVSPSKREVKSIVCGKDYTQTETLQVVVFSNDNQTTFGSNILSARSELSEVDDSRGLPSNLHWAADEMQKRKLKEDGGEPMYAGYTGKTHKGFKTIGAVVKEAAVEFSFVGCGYSELMQYEDVNLGQIATWHGHLTLPGTGKCVQPIRLAKLNVRLVAGDCSLQDHSTQLFLYWRLTKYQQFDPVTKISTFKRYLTFLGEPAKHEADDFAGDYSTRYIAESKGLSINYRRPNDTKGPVGDLAFLSFSDTKVLK